jgi:hypothetical protein
VEFFSVNLLLKSCQIEQGVYQPVVLAAIATARPMKNSSIVTGATVGLALAETTPVEGLARPRRFLVNTQVSPLPNFSIEHEYIASILEHNNELRVPSHSQLEKDERTKGIFGLFL